MSKLFIFDLDDTLMWNAYTYSLAHIEFLKYLVMIFENRIPSVSSILQAHEKIDVKKIKQLNPRTNKEYSFSIDRFKDSLVDTYKLLCKNDWGTYEEIHANHIRYLVDNIFQEETYRCSGLVPFAEETLRFLKEGGNQLALLTKGDAAIQELKINALQLKRWFSSISIVDNKNTETFMRVAKGFDHEAVYSVGNSFSSDIRPALDSGMKAIFIPCFTWVAESDDTEKLVEEKRKRLIEFKKIIEIKEKYNLLP